MKTEWKQIPDYENYYEVSTTGVVRSFDRVDTQGRIRKGKVLKPATVRGQLKVVLCVDSNRKMIGVHQLVAMAFLGHKPNGHKLLVDHIDNNPLNNNLYNLQLISNRENCSKDKKNKTSKYTGVSWNTQKGKWVSQINKGLDKIYLGQFDCELKAALVYSNKLKTLQDAE